MKAKIFLAFAAVLFAAVMASCSRDDGDWDPMKWRTDVKTAKDGYVEVPEEGGTYVFTCKNYPGFWLSELYEAEGTNGRMYYADSRGDSDFYHINSAWSTIASEDGKLYVTISPNTTANVRTFCLSVTAGDIFHTFRFRQSAASAQ